MSGMTHNTDRILTTHAGSLPRPLQLRQMVLAASRGEEVDPAELNEKLRSGIAEVVRKQIECGLDSINDGELPKSSFTEYVRSRLSGYEMVPAREARRLQITARDGVKFADYFAANPMRWAQRPETLPVCTSALRYIGGADISRDIAYFKAALQGVSREEAFMSAVTPGAIEHWLSNRHYRDDEEFLFAIADAVREEYLAIVGAGLQLQIDSPDLLDVWNCFPQMTLPQYRDYAALRVEALNHALRGIPAEKMRMHVCWGSFHGPHHDDVPLKDIIDILFRVRVGSYSIEASNPGHEHEWTIFETVKMPPDTTLVPGVVGHCSDFIEHPDLVAQRLVRYAKLLGRENVLAGTDCGLGPRVGHPSVCWAKFEALVEGARGATKLLWGR
jgi:5-methyltetrahydropteroyltriglutamate--homocysteine methyltransferase